MVERVLVEIAGALRAVGHEREPGAAAGGTSVTVGQLGERPGGAHRLVLVAELGLVGEVDGDCGFDERSDLLQAGLDLILLAEQMAETRGDRGLGQAHQSLEITARSAGTGTLERHGEVVEGRDEPGAVRRPIATRHSGEKGAVGREDGETKGCVCGPNGIRALDQCDGVTTDRSILSRRIGHQEAHLIAIRHAPQRARPVTGSQVRHPGKGGTRPRTHSGAAPRGNDRRAHPLSWPPAA